MVNLVDSLAESTAHPLAMQDQITDSSVSKWSIQVTVYQNTLLASKMSMAQVVESSRTNGQLIHLLEKF
jgi:hypothetical protein